MISIAEFLLVDDNQYDIRLAQEYFKEYKISNRLAVVHNEEEALTFLRHQDQYIEETLPDLILISISVLRIPNSRLLQELKADPELAIIPVVVMTAFEGEEIILGNNLPISFCVIKPLNLECLYFILKQINDFWLTITVDR